jgi:hypothetical protein
MVKDLSTQAWLRQTMMNPMLKMTWTNSNLSVQKTSVVAKDRSRLLRVIKAGDVVGLSKDRTGEVLAFYTRAFQSAVTPS